MTTTISWQLKSKGFAFCHCQPRGTCNFSGFLTLPDGSVKAAVVTRVVRT